MKHRIWMWFKKRGLMLLSAIVWRLDDWIHAQQVKLQNELAGAKRQPILRAGSVPGPAAARAGAHRETFLQWEARKSGVTVISKKEARRHRERVTASGFDRRFAT
jgi:hypothetical protein